MSINVVIGSAASWVALEVWPFPVAVLGGTEGRAALLCGAQGLSVSQNFYSASGKSISLGPLLSTGSSLVLLCVV